MHVQSGEQVGKPAQAASSAVVEMVADIEDIAAVAVCVVVVHCSEVVVADDGAAVARQPVALPYASPCRPSRKLACRQSCISWHSSV